MNKDFKKFANSKGIPSTSLDKYNNYMTPYIVKSNSDHLLLLDVFSQLMSERTIYLSDIDDITANIINAQLLYLNSQSKEDIRIYINSPGGDVISGMAIIDLMDYIDCDVSTVCCGMAASMGAVILAHGTKGKRASLPLSRIMIHQVLSFAGSYMQASDLDIHNKETQFLKKQLTQILANDCNQTFSKIKSLCDRDYWMSAEDTKKIGLIDKILNKK